MSGYRERAAKEIREERPSATVTPIMRKLLDDSARMLARGPADARERATAARMYAVEHLEELHEEMRANLERRGVHYHRAATAEDAVAIFRKLLAGSKRVAKSKSMVAEEAGLTHALRGEGIDVLETDIGEYIVDLEGRGPSHITAPALHLNRARIRELFERTGARFPDDDPVRLSQYVRDVVGAYFQECDAAITGTNVSIASSGRLGIVENEGNVSLGVSHPRLHIVITGLEKIVADEDAALAVLEVLAPSATAQPLTSFTHFLAGPMPGQERHVVFLDNGRSEIAKDERYREILKCIRCGACMNACPVYRTAGGLSYGSPYMGPIGAVISPLLYPDGRYADLPMASTLCGRCTEVCPVGIPIHRMLLELRSDGVEQGRLGSLKEKAAWMAYAETFRGATRARAASAMARIGLRGAARIVRPHGDKDDPRMLPEPDGSHDTELLLQATEDRSPMVVVSPEEIAPEDTGELFAYRARALGVQVVAELEPREGDHVLRATAAIANTGSVLLTGAEAARRPLLSAKRVVVRVDPVTIVRDPHEIAPYLGDGDALILTGASRTADIEKQIVRGIHGAEEMVVIVS
ncbi:MAG: LUD domain-containing protein [Dehalococcoidia bacterium]|nr:LUD domain-containing protein [Dehalococcoidia bacterium]